MPDNSAPGAGTYAAGKKPSRRGKRSFKANHKVRKRNAKERKQNGAFSAYGRRPVRLAKKPVRKRAAQKTATVEGAP
jgi:hypothetical protein